MVEGAALSNGAALVHVLAASTTASTQSTKTILFLHLDALQSRLVYHQAPIPP